MSTLSTQERQRFDQRVAAIRSIDPAAVIPLPERHRHDLRDVRTGGVFRRAGKTYQVSEVGTYRETDDNFKPTKKKFIVTELKLFCLETAGVHYIEWEYDDALEICFTGEKLKGRSLGRRLTYDDGESFDPDDIDQVVDREWELLLDGVVYDYDDDWSAIYTASGNRRFYVFFGEFEAENGTMLTVEAWTDDPKAEDKWEYEVFTSYPVEPSEIEILSLGSGD